MCVVRVTAGVTLVATGERRAMLGLSDSRRQRRAGRPAPAAHFIAATKGRTSHCSAAMTAFNSTRHSVYVLIH